MFTRLGNVTPKFQPHWLLIFLYLYPTPVAPEVDLSNVEPLNPCSSRILRLGPHDTRTSLELWPRGRLEAKPDPMSGGWCASTACLPRRACRRHDLWRTACTQQQVKARDITRCGFSTRPPPYLRRFLSNPNGNDWMKGR